MRSLVYERAMATPGRAQKTFQLDAAVAGPLLMLSAALLFTMLNVLIKLLGPQFRVWDIGFYRFVGGIALLLAVFGRRRNLYKGNNIRLLIIRGCTGSAAFICLVTALRMLPISTALVIFYSFPVFSAIFSFLLYGERISRFEVVCMFAVFVGIGILFDFQLAGGIVGQAVGLAAGIFAGLTVTLIRTLREKNGPVVIYLYFCTMGMLVTLPKFIQQPIIPVNAVEWTMVLGIIVLSVAAQLLMNQGFFYCRGWEGGVFMSSEVVFTAIVGIVFLKDPVSWRFWLGGCLVLSSVIALNRLMAGKAGSNRAMKNKR
jgi:drug/metabolite transporter (DMT)-like permease